MKTTSLLFIFITVLNGNAQYSEYNMDSLTAESYTRGEIRQMILKTNSHQTDAYHLAKQSRKNTTWSTVFYAVGAFGVIGGISGLIEMQDDSPSKSIGESAGSAVLPFATTIGFGTGAVGIGLGIWQTRKAQRKIDKAITLL